MRHFAESTSGSGTDGFRRAVFAHKIGETRLYRLVALTQQIVVAIGNFRRIVLMIGKIVMRDVSGKTLQFRRCLFSSEIIDRLICCRLAHTWLPMSLAAAARASSVTVAPASIRAISSRRSRSSRLSTRVATRAPLDFISLLEMRK